MRIDVVTIFPDILRGPLAESLLGRAIARGLVEVGFVDPRDFTVDRHRQVDDEPFGGGPGMVMKPEPIFAAVESLGPVVGRLTRGQRARFKRSPGYPNQPSVNLHTHDTEQTHLDQPDRLATLRTVEPGAPGMLVAHDQRLVHSDAVHQRRVRVRYSPPSGIGPVGDQHPCSRHRSGIESVHRILDIRGGSGPGRVGRHRTRTALPDVKSCGGGKPAGQDK